MVSAPATIDEEDDLENPLRTVRVGLGLVKWLAVALVLWVASDWVPFAHGQGQKASDSSPRVVQLNPPPPASNLDADHEIGFRLSRLLRDLGSRPADVRGLLNSFATGRSFPNLRKQYAGKTTIEVLNELQGIVSDRDVSAELARMTNTLSTMDKWSDARIKQLETPRAIAGEVIRSFVLPRWRALDYAFLDCPATAPFC